MTISEEQRIRLDLWLWRARFFKTRTLAARICRARRVRINGVPAEKASVLVGPGTTLTFPAGRQIRTIKIGHVPARRGPATEAQALYTDLTPEDDAPLAKTSVHGRRGARPTKRERRRLEQNRAAALAAVEDRPYMKPSESIGEEEC